MKRRSAIVLCPLVALAIAACGPGTVSQATPRGSFAATAFPLESGGSALPPEPPPSVDSLPPTADPGSAAQEFPDAHQQPDLDQILDITVGGVALSTSSRSGADAAAAGSYLPGLLAALKRGEQDLSTAYAADPAGNLQLVVFAVRIRSENAADILTAFLALTNLQDLEEADVSGKRVRRIVADWTSYLYAANDTLIIIQALDPAHAEEALHLLP